MFYLNLLFKYYVFDNDNADVIVKSEAGKFNLRVSPMAVAKTISVGHGSEKT